MAEKKTTKKKATKKAAEEKKVEEATTPEKEDEKVEETTSTTTDNLDEKPEEEKPAEPAESEQPISNDVTPEQPKEEKSGLGWYIFFIIIIGGIIYFYTTGGIGTPKQAEQQVEEPAEVVPSVIKLGYMGPLSGDAASYGESIQKGVDLALKEANFDNVEIIYEDTKCDGKEAVNAINKLINVDNVVAIIGEVCSGATLAAAPIAEENNVVLISPSSTSPKISDAGDYIFRTVPSDAYQGAFASSLMYREGTRNLAILYSNEEYGVGFNEVLEKSFPGEVVASEAFERGSADLRTQLTKIKEQNPDAIYIISNSPDSAVAALKQIKELNIRADIYGSEGLKGPEVAETLAADGLIVSSVSSGSFEFNLKHQDEYDSEPGPFAAQGYDALAAVARAIKKGADNGRDIKNELYSTTFDGGSGRISFDLNGDIGGNYEVYTLDDGEWILN